MKNAVVLVVLFSAIAVLVAALAIKAPAIERDLEERASLALAGTGMHADIDGLNATLMGFADSEAHQEKGLIRLAALDGLDVLNDHSLIRPMVSPYATSATRRPDGVLVLEGSAPNGDAAAKAAEMALALDTIETVENFLRVGTGAPEQWEETLADGLRALDTLSIGRLSLVDNAVTIDGFYEDNKAIEAFSALNRPGWSVIVRQSPFGLLEEMEAENAALSAELTETKADRAAQGRADAQAVAARAYAEGRISALEAAIKTLERARQGQSQ